MAKGTDMGGIIKIAAIGIGGYFLYDWWSKRSASSGATPTATDKTPAPVAAASFNSLDGIYQRLSAAVGGGNFTADGWNVYLKQQLPAGKEPPDPADFLPAGADRNATMTLANYWGVVSPKIKAVLGLSGLGVYGGLYSVMRGSR